MFLTKSLPCFSDQSYPKTALTLRGFGRYKGATEFLGAGKSKEIGLESEFDVLSLKKEKLNMLSWSITFLIIGIIAGVLGLSGIAATQIAWILFVVFLVLFVVTLIMGRRPPV
jgi:uncharacterized membrane protein YtjA (UPF0391 family)